MRRPPRLTRDDWTEEDDMRKRHLRWLLVLASLACVSCAHKITRDNLPISPQSINCPDLDFSKLRAAEARGNYRDYEEEVRALLPIGSPVERVICVLEGTHWSYGYHKGRNLYTAYKDWGWIIDSRANIWIHMDQDNRVKQVSVTVMTTFL